MTLYDNRTFVSVCRPEPNNWDKDICGIPFIEKETLPISLIGSKLFLINPNNVSRNDMDKSREIVHSFQYDDHLDRIYNNPIKYFQKTSGYYAITSLDFSLYPGMSEWLIINSVAKSRWFGRYGQSLGIRVFPTVNWLDEKTYDICFSGLRDGSTFFLSNLGANNKDGIPVFLNGLYELRRRFPHSQQICIGNRFKGIPEDVCTVPYEDTFGGRNQAYKRNQVRLFNWDGTISKEED